MNKVVEFEPSAYNDAMHSIEIPVYRHRGLEKLVKGVINYVHDYSILQRYPHKSLKKLMGGLEDFKKVEQPDRDSAKRHAKQFIEKYCEGTLHREKSEKFLIRLILLKRRDIVIDAAIMKLKGIYKQLKEIDDFWDGVFEKAANHFDADLSEEIEKGTWYPYLKVIKKGTDYKVIPTDQEKLRYKRLRHRIPVTHRDSDDPWSWVQYGNRVGLGDKKKRYLALVVIQHQKYEVDDKDVVTRAFKDLSMLLLALMVIHYEGKKYEGVAIDLQDIYRNILPDDQAAFIAKYENLAKLLSGSDEVPLSGVIDFK